jgi:hypothetical protein
MYCTNQDLGIIIMGKYDGAMSAITRVILRLYASQFWLNGGVVGMGMGVALAVLEIYLGALSWG